MLIRPATDADLTRVRELCRAFRDMLFDRAADRSAVVEHYYSAPVYEDIMARLPLIHAAPNGAIHVAELDGMTVGCAMIHRIDPETCEVKRVYVDPQARRRGAAKKLMLSVMDDARRRGYRRMVLDTLVWLSEAVALYESLGFGEVAPYHDLPERFHHQILFLGRAL